MMRQNGLTRYGKRQPRVLMVKYDIVALVSALSCEPKQEERRVYCIQQYSLRIAEEKAAAVRAADKYKNEMEPSAFYPLSSWTTNLSLYRAILV